MTNNTTSKKVLESTAFKAFRVTWYIVTEKATGSAEYTECGLNYFLDYESAKAYLLWIHDCDKTKYGKIEEVLLDGSEPLAYGRLAVTQQSILEMSLGYASAEIERAYSKIARATSKGYKYLKAFASKPNHSVLDCWNECEAWHTEIIKPLEEKAKKYIGIAKVLQKALQNSPKKSEK